MKIVLILFIALAFLVGVYLLARGHKDSPLPDPAPPSGSGSGTSPATHGSVAIDQFLYDRCCRYMAERRPFLVESFSLGDLAAALYTNKVYLSKTINHFSGKHFRQYVNHYRVMYAMEIFRNDMRLKVNELADLSGFHSSTTFNSAFKAVMDESPSTWCARLRMKRYGKKTK
ncbi:MAG: helix-turn-helix transcriptional regulator [Bacteroidales bacterium]|nr:helix-turn-helix transcriptional regulator [Bacteroidales bacterium]